LTEKLSKLRSFERQ